MEIVSVQRKNYLWLLFRFIKVYTERISWRAITGDSGRSRGLDHRAMPGAPVSYRLKLECCMCYIIFFSSCVLALCSHILFFFHSILYITLYTLSDQLYMSLKTRASIFFLSQGDSRYFISNCKDQTLKLWDVRNFSDSSSVNVSAISTPPLKCIFPISTNKKKPCLIQTCLPSRNFRICP